MIKFTVAHAQSILTAYYKKSVSVDDTVCVFINCFGEIILQLNAFNFKTIGKIIDENTFKVGKMTYHFPKDLAENLQNG